MDTKKYLQGINTNNRSSQYIIDSMPHEIDKIKAKKDKQLLDVFKEWRVADNEYIVNDCTPEHNRRSTDKPMNRRSTDEH